MSGNWNLIVVIFLMYKGQSITFRSKQFPGGQTELRDTLCDNRWPVECHAQSQAVLGAIRVGESCPGNAKHLVLLPQPIIESSHIDAFGEYEPDEISSPGVLKCDPWVEIGG